MYGYKNMIEMVSFTLPPVVALLVVHSNCKNFPGSSLRKQKNLKSNCNKAMKNIPLVKEFVFHPLIYPLFSRGRKTTMLYFQFG